MDWNDKMHRKILLDGNEISWRDLIKEAAKLDRDFRRSQLKQTSVAAEILREHNHIVEEKWSVN